MNKLAKFLKNPFVCTVFAVILGFAVAAVILVASGYEPLGALKVMFNAVFSKPKSMINVVLRSVPIILTGLSVTFAFKVGLFNIGVEGQFVMATIASTAAGIAFNFPPVIQIPLVLGVGVAAGALHALLCGFLKTKFGIHEVISGIMLNWIAFYFNNFLAGLATFHKPQTDGTFPINSSGFTTLFYNWKTSAEGKNFFKSNHFWSEIIQKTDFNLNFLFAVLVAVAVWVMINKTKKGFEIRAIGFNPDAALNAGMNVNKNILFSMLVSGALAGLAGALVITGMEPHNIHMLGMFENNGFDGLSVALIAGASPIGCIFAALLYSGLIFAGQALPFTIGAPSEIVSIMLGTVVFFVACIRFVPILVNNFLMKKEEKSSAK